MDIQNFRLTDKLKDGTMVTIRSIRPDDKKRLDDAFKNLESESIYTRFFGAKRKLTDEELKTATEVDFENTVALVVTILTDAGEETIIGAGRYIRCDTADGLRSAEIAFTVEEDYQGKGIASRILRHLIDIAREKGVSRFEAVVLPQNRAMLAVFERTGFPMKRSLADGEVHVYITLSTDASGAPGSDRLP
ncbi:MAG: GNAT family N-acetyltransferase [Desulfatirhabdiaceae bacterium]